MTVRSNLVLIGMPGSGKSTVGLLAAKVLGLDFVDTDLVLQNRTGMRLTEILQQEGTEGFLRQESRMLTSLRADRTVFATGGSAVYHREGMEHLKNHGLIVWLDVPFAELSRRLGDIAGRGVVLQAGQTLQHLYQERLPLYRSWADQRMSVAQEPLETTVNRLVQLVGLDLTPGRGSRS